MEGGAEAVVDVDVEAEVIPVIVEEVVDRLEGRLVELALAEAVEEVDAEAVGVSEKGALIVGNSWHDVEPVAKVNVPAGQSVQLEAPA